MICRSLHPPRIKDESSPIQRKLAIYCISGEVVLLLEMSMMRRSSFTNLSWQYLASKLEAPQNSNSTSAALEHEKTTFVWSNSDLEPTKPAFRTWTWVHYSSFWLASSFATGTWTTGSAMIALGMPWYAAWLAIVVSHTIGAMLLVANGRGPAAYHIGFPVFARASFGMWGSYFAILSRCIVVSLI